MVWDGVECWKTVRPRSGANAALRFSALISTTTIFPDQRPHDV